MEEAASICALRLSHSAQELLCCPVCRAKLGATERGFLCVNSLCSAEFPIVDGIPILINDAASLFSTDDFLSRRQTTLKLRKNSLKRLIPKMGKNLAAEKNY